MDYGHKLSDEQLNKLEKKLKSVYQKAYKELKKKTDDYFLKFQDRDSKKLVLVNEGKLSQQEYNKWRANQITAGERWVELRDNLAYECQNANATAQKLISDHAKDIFALNYNYGIFEVEKGVKIDTMFTLCDRSTVERLVKSDVDLLPVLGEPKTERGRKAREAKAFRYNKRQVQSVATQGILQGESIPNISKRVARELGETNLNSAVRTARTITTSAENGGRLASYQEAEELGIKMKKIWVATLDARTRESHRECDGEEVGVNDEFSNELQYPGDPSGEAEEVYNCRCTIEAAVDGSKLSDSFRQSRENANIGGMSYDEWVKAKPKYKTKDKKNVKR